MTVTLGTFEQNMAAAAAITLPRRATIGGSLVDAASGATFDNISPIDGRLINRVAYCGDVDVDAAVHAARKTFEAGNWSGLAAAVRKRYLLRLADVLEGHGSELALLESLDVGKPIRFSAGGDIPAAIGVIRWYAEAIDKVYDQIAPTPVNQLGLITREPVGVVAAVVPWNFPLLISAWKIAPALAAGNSVVLKPAEQSPLTALRLGELALEAGLPPGVLNIVPGDGPVTGRALGRHMNVDLLTFTGSTQVGRQFLRYSAESNLKILSLECGGKSPNLILAGADVPLAAHAAAQSVFYNAGQVCVAATRVIVEEDLLEPFTAALLDATRLFVPAHPLDPSTAYGCIGSASHLERVLGYVRLGMCEGATLLHGGEAASPVARGSYMLPTVLANVENGMRIAREEIFGPVLSVLRCRGAGEAIQIANDSPYGLQACLWTRDLDTAHDVARRLRAGTVVVNGVASTDIAMPLTGWKQSGFGSDRSLLALEKYTQAKATVIYLDQRHAPG